VQMRVAEFPDCRRKDVGRKPGSRSNRYLPIFFTACLIRESRTPFQERRCQRYCRRRTDFFFLTARSLRPSFAADVEPRVAAFMADSQVPWGLEALIGTATKPA